MELINQICQFVPAYDYNYFDEYNQLQTRQLNIFQCAFRKLFGWYDETHLSNVVKKAYTVTLNDQFTQGPAKRQELLKLILKSESVYAAQSYIKLPEYQLPSGTSRSISMRYEISIPERETDSFKISSVDFKIEPSRDGRISLEQPYHVGLYKNKSQRIVAQLPRDLFQGNTDDTKDSINTRLNGEEATIINNLFAKVLNDSSSAHEMADIKYYATDYRWLPYFSRELNRPMPDALNKVQEKAMQELGWEYLEPFTESRPGWNGGITNLKRVYHFTKEAAEQNRHLTTAGFNQNLSMAFAIQSLATGSQEYYGQ